MAAIIDIPILKKFIPDNVENTETFLSRLYISASAKIDEIKVPDELFVQFDENNKNLGKLVSLEPCFFFPRATGLFLDRKKAESILRTIKAKAAVIGINILAIKKSIENKKLENISGYDLYREIMTGYGLIETAFLEDVYTELRNAMLYLPLNNASRLIYGNKYPDSSSGCTRLAKLMKNKLHLSYWQQIAFVSEVNEKFKKIKPINKNVKYTSEQVKTIRKEIWSKIWPEIGFFSNYKDSPSYVKNVEECIYLIHAINHFLSVLQTIEIFNRSGSNAKGSDKKAKKENKTNELRFIESTQSANSVNDLVQTMKSVKVYDPEKLTFASNNILIECDIILDSVKAVMLCNNLEKRRVIFIEPSFTLIDRWYRDTDFENISVFFVLDNNEINDILLEYNRKKGKTKKDFVRFMSSNDYIASPVCEDGEMILCTNMNSLNHQKYESISHRKKRHPDSVIIAVDYDKSFSSHDSLVAIEQRDIAKIIIWPIGIENEKDCKRSLWISNNSKKENVVVEFLSRKDKNDKNIIKKVAFKSFDRNSCFPSDKEKLRDHLRESTKDNIDKHSSKCPIMFSPSIKLYPSGFSEIPLSCGKSSFKINICVQFKAKDSFIPVPEARITRRFSSIDEAKDFLYKEYPFSFKVVKENVDTEENIETENVPDEPIFEGLSFRKTKKSLTEVGKNKRHYVGSIVRRKMDDYRARYPVLFKEFMFLFYDQLNKCMDEKELKILKMLFFDSTFAMRSLHDITPDFLFEYLSDEDKFDDVFYAHAFNALKIVFDIAVDYCLLQRNEFAYVKDDEQEWNKLVNRTTRALTKKDFTKEEFKKLYTYLINKIYEPFLEGTKISEKDFESEKSESLCMLISLLTGLESNIVAAIKWRDVDFVSDEGCVVTIVRQLTNTGSSEYGIEDDYDHRPLPFGRILTRMLAKGLEKLKVWAGNDKKRNAIVKECYIANVFNTDISTMQRRTVPRRITEAENKIITSVLNIKECMIYIPAFAGGTKENDISRYRGNILRENFRHYAIKVGGFTEDEIAYFYGNKPLSTLGLSYKDFRYVGNLMVLNVKLNRIASMLEEDENEKIFTSDKQGCFIKSSNPTCLDLAFETESSCELIVSVNHGFRILAEEEEDAD